MLHFRLHDFCAVLQRNCPIVQMGPVTMRTVLTALTVASMVGGLVSCAEKSSDEKPVPETRVSQTTPQIFSVKGAVKELKPDGKTVVIKHEEIPNYMRSEEHTSELQSQSNIVCRLL